MKFDELGIHPHLLKALADAQYTEPTPIQEEAIPPALQGRDILGCAQTGTGKTAAFAIPILQLLARQERMKGFPPIRALILTPTRELAIQIYDNFELYGKYTGLKCALVFGGVSQYPQVEALNEGVDILVATPGRLNDLAGQGYIDLSDISVFVLDEADRMLDMGFIHDVKRVIGRMPQKKQTLFFSATMPKEVQALVDTLLTDPVKIAVTPQSTTVEAIEQSLYFVDKSNKRALLLHLLKEKHISSALVFTRTKYGADRVVRDLNRAKVSAKAIHGNKSQGARQAALADFKDGLIQVLVATDIAARGIDISELSHVINFDLPNIPESYVHRIGRTGRAGQSGAAISFCEADEVPYLRDIEKTIGKPIPVVEDHPYPMTQKPVETHTGGNQKSRSGKPRGSSQTKGPQVSAEGRHSAPPRRRAADVRADRAEKTENHRFHKNKQQIK